MRFSSDPTDRGYDHYLTAKHFNLRVDVTLDGVPLKSVMTADDVEGIAVVCADPLRVVDDEVATETLRGVVAFEITPQA